METKLTLIFLLVVTHFFNFSLTKSLVIERNGRIVGGERTTEENYPYYQSFCQTESDCCSGVNLNENWLITTASCVSKIIKNFKNEVSYVIHPRYNPEFKLFDVALVSVAAESDEFVDLPSRNEAIFHGTDTVIVGTDSEVT